MFAFTGRMRLYVYKSNKIENVARMVPSVRRELPENLPCMLVHCLYIYHQSLHLDLIHLSFSHLDLLT